MIRALARYAHWLHLRWPAGAVEALPELRDEDGGTRVPGVFVAGDLKGIPLLKFALDSGVRAVRRIARELQGTSGADDGVLDLAIVGAGVSGIAAAAEAKSLGLTFVVFEAGEPLSTLANFPKRKPIYTYPSGFEPAGRVQVRADIKEELVEELRAQARAHAIEVVAEKIERIERRGGVLVAHGAGGTAWRARRVLLAVGRSGDVRRLGVPGEDLDHVFNRLHDPADFAGRSVLVVGGGDTALEAAIALTHAGAHVTLSYRGRAWSRPKPENVRQIERLLADPRAPVQVERPSDERQATAVGDFDPPEGGAGSLAVRFGTEVERIEPGSVLLRDEAGPRTPIPNDVVFVMIGRDPPLAFLRRSGVAIAGERTAGWWAGLVAFLLLACFVYDWKSGGITHRWFAANRWFPFDLADRLAAAGGAIAASAADPRTLLGTLAISATGPAFWYTVAYSALVTVFGIRRIRRRRTAYVTAQTWTLIAVQVLPLFLLPEVILPLLHHHGALPAWIADPLFPAASYGHGREFWRAYGLILAWPLNVYNVFTPEPLPAWLAISAVQTLVLLPLAIYFFGKGVYCGWICSCGALAETLGDTHRHKMPHGPKWNRLNLAGQAILAIACVLLVVRVAGWILPDGNAIDRAFDPLLKEPYKWAVDVFLAGAIGYGVYFWLSGRVWCRFFCPLAALMHVYARFSRFAIVAEKKKCISCNVCTSVCHQGIDVMSFANKGLPMQDPQCVRCAACVGACPTGMLAFGQVDRAGVPIALDRLPASRVRMRER